VVTVSIFNVITKDCYMVIAKVHISDFDKVDVNDMHSHKLLNIV